MAKCLVKDPTKRPTAAQLLDHKFFKVRLLFVPLNLLGLTPSIKLHGRSARLALQCSYTHCKAILLP